MMNSPLEKFKTLIVKIFPKNIKLQQEFGRHFKKSYSSLTNGDESAPKIDFAECCNQLAEQRKLTEGITIYELKAMLVGFTVNCEQRNIFSITDNDKLDEALAQNAINHVNRMWQLDDETLTAVLFLIVRLIIFMHKNGFSIAKGKLPCCPADEQKASADEYTAELAAYLNRSLNNCQEPNLYETSILYYGLFAWCFEH